MALSNRQLMDVLEQFESRSDAQDSRQTARICIRRHVTVITDPQSDAGTREVVLQDISRGGVRITYHEAFARGLMFLLMLPTRDGAELAVPCVVRHCEMIKQHLFRIGAQFETSDGPR